MKKLVILFCILVSCLSTIRANSFPKVRLTFYLDATQSMKPHTGPNLWEESKNCLKDAINSIEDSESTEVKICVFADAHKRGSSNSPEQIFGVFSVCPFTKADEMGKEKLCRFVDSLKEPGEGLPAGYETLTNLDKPLMDFINSNTGGNNNVKNVMILITDGIHETPDDFEGNLRKWHESTGNNSYGFVVELRPTVGKNEQAAKERMDRIIDDQKSKGRLRRTDKHDFNFKFISFNCSVDSINIRETQSFNINISSNTKRALQFIGNLKFKSKNHFNLSHTVFNDSTIQIKISNYDLAKEPFQQPLEVICSIDEDFERDNLLFLLNSSIKLNCINNFSRSLNICLIKKKKDIEVNKDYINDLGDIEYYESWKLFGKTISGDSIVPVKVRLKFNLNKDAIDRNSIARLVFVDKNNKPFDNKSIRITDINGNILEDILIQKDSFIGDYIITFDPELYKEGSISGYLRLVDNKSLDFACGQKLDNVSSYNIMQWEVDIDNHWNPLFVKFLWILFALLCLLLIFLYIIWHHRTFSLRFPTEGRAVFTPIGNAQNIQILGCNFKEQQIVAPGGSDTILTELLNNSYIKEIVIINQNCNTPYIPKSQGWWDRIWNGDSIFINGTFANYPINHLVIKPSGTLTKEDINITINFQTENATFINPQSITLPIHTITPTNPITPNVIIQKTNNSVCVFGNSPLHAIHRTFLHQVIKFSINIFNH